MDMSIDTSSDNAEKEILVMQLTNKLQQLSEFDWNSKVKILAGDEAC